MARVNSTIPSTRGRTQVQATVAYCKGTIRSGRFAGFRCGNVSPCMEHDILPKAYILQAQGPDEYPLGFYIEMARQRLRERPVATKTKRRGSVLW